MKITHQDGEQVEIPQDVADAARLVGDWFDSKGFGYWQFLRICSRDYAYTVERVRIVTDPAFKNELDGGK